MRIVKELRETADVFEVLKLLKEGWLLIKVASHQDNYKFLMIQI
ncbi:hypothetical protein [Paenibacillus sp. FSL M7-1046]